MEFIYKKCILRVTTVKMIDFVQKIRISLGMMSNSDKDDDRGKINGSAGDDEDDEDGRGY